MSLGYHVEKNEGSRKRSMLDALGAAVELLRGFNVSRSAAQIFVTGPQNRKENIPESDYEAIKHLVAKEQMQLVIHGAYIDMPWSRTARENGEVKPGVHNIRREMKIAQAIGATGVVVHLSSGAYDALTLQYVLEKIGEDADYGDCILWLETHTAKQSEFTYETPAKIRRLFEKVAACQPTFRVGLCVDSAHVFSCGVALDNYDKTHEWLAGLPDVPLMFHLNDSKSSLGSGVDRHEELTMGKIWSAYNEDTGSMPLSRSGLMAILDWAVEHNNVVILERHKGGIDNDIALITGAGYFTGEV